jgi:2-methylcitrate dehydratase PrpD
MTAARELAEFPTRTAASDIPQQAIEHTAMLIASTVASAAMGARLESAEIIRTLARERGGARRLPCGLLRPRNCSCPTPRRSTR